MKRCGIYCIRNDVNKKIYIGSSKNIKSRWRRHKSDLNRGDHRNPHLQSAWNKYGKDEFEFYVLEECKEEKLIEKENYYIYLHKTIDNKYGYNLTDANRLNVSDTVRKHMSEAKLNMTDEKKELWAERSTTRFKKGHKVWNEGLKYNMSEECKENHRKANKKRYEDPNERKKTSEASKAYWASMSEEERNLRSETMKKYWKERRKKEKTN